MAHDTHPAACWITPSLLSRATNACLGVRLCTIILAPQRRACTHSHRYLSISACLSPLLRTLLHHMCQHTRCVRCLLLHPTESSGVAKPGRQAVRALAGAAKAICMTSTSQLLKTSDEIHSTRQRNPMACR